MEREGEVAVGSVVSELCGIICVTEQAVDAMTTTALSDAIKADAKVRLAAMGYERIRALIMRMDWVAKVEDQWVVLFEKEDA